MTTLSELYVNQMSDMGEATGFIPFEENSATNFEQISYLDISVVIPIYNEKDNLEFLFEKLQQALDDIPYNSEVILVDDGSRDNGFSIMKHFPERDGRFRVVKLRRNFGQTAAFSAGFDHARGEIIITMDGDLQNDPTDIEQLVEKLNEGYDVVSGWRVNRQDKYWSRRFPSKIANWLISRLTKVDLHDYGCSLKAYRREVLENTRLYGEMHRFIPALANMMGAEIAEVPVNHHARQFGTSKYGIGRTIRVLLDLMTVKFLLDYATRPMQVFGLLGLLSSGAGVAIASYLTVLRLFFNQGLADRPLLLLAILLIVVGVQLLIMGLLGELTIRTYHETQKKPIYSVRTVVQSKKA